MHRIQVQLTPEQERLLRELAAARGSSISALIREGVDAVLGPQVAERRRSRDRAVSLIGAFQSETGDVSENHDEYFVEAIEAKWAENRKKRSS
jgi:Arc/MetJ-type ribon-helix-helix transcriptional regulator